MGEKMILIPYSEYQELINRPEDYKAKKMLESIKELRGIMANIEYDPHKLLEHRSKFLKAENVLAFIDATITEAERIAGD